MITDKMKEKLYFYHYDLLNFFQKRAVKKLLAKSEEYHKEYESIKDKIALFNLQPEAVSSELDKQILNEYSIRTNQKLSISKRKPVSLYLKFSLGLCFIFICVLGINYFMKSRYGIIQIKNSIVLNGKNIKKSHILSAQNKISVPDRSEARIIHKKLYNITLYKQADFFISRIGSKSFYMRLDHGHSYFQIQKNTADYSIETINTLIKVTGTEFYLTVDPYKTSVDLIEGNLIILDKSKMDKTIILKSGSKIDIKIRRLPKEMNKFNPINNSYLKDKIYLYNGTTIAGQIMIQTKDEVVIKSAIGILRFEQKEIKRIETGN